LRQSALIVLLGVSVVLPMPAIAQGQTVETGIVKLADSNIEYFSRGEGQSIVLLPGGTLTVGYLDGLADALAKGASKGVTLNTFANDVAGVSEALKIGPANVAGNDFGNRVARMLAASHPELTRSVILLAAGGKIPPKPAAFHALEVIFNPASTDVEILTAMPYFVSNPAESAHLDTL
jgi:pimeloyl-ACP methyl ester carboxylesterase